MKLEIENAISEDSPVQVKLKTATWIKLIGVVVACITAASLWYYQITSAVAEGRANDVKHDNQIGQIMECQTRIDESVKNIKEKLTDIEKKIDALAVKQNQRRQ